MKVFWAFIAVLIVAAAAAILARATPATSVGGGSGADRGPDLLAVSPSTPGAGDSGRRAGAASASELTGERTPSPGAAVPAHARGSSGVLDELEENRSDELPEALRSLVSDALGGETPLRALEKAGPGSPGEAAEGGANAGERFVIKGQGTREDPYQITWEFLLSAQETYKPRLGQKKLPEWLSIVDDKWVRLSGYVAFPIMAENPDEMLLMLNQWDGCCIGVPPTPYDAVEVRLKDAAAGEDRLKVYGTVLGKFDVDPYLVKDWLVGLYTMSDATIIASDSSR